jgi:hypothetical protein
MVILLSYGGFHMLQNCHGPTWGALSGLVAFYRSRKRSNHHQWDGGRRDDLVPMGSFPASEFSVHKGNPGNLSQDEKVLIQLPIPTSGLRFRVY